MSETLPDPQRPRQTRSVATFEAILEAAARILESLGFAGFNTNAVAELAGVSIGSLYQYFPSKDALIVELIRRERAQLSNHIVEAIQ
ncbi:TetR/AcrR family transcriptional regulator, partial [Acinetobacter baumannii]